MKTRLLLVAAGVWVACSAPAPAAAPKEQVEPAPATAPQAGEKGAQAAAGDAPKKAAPKGAKKGGKGAEKIDKEKRNATPEEVLALKSYRAAMKEGREKTRAKKYTEAIAAFDRAIAALPDNTARAISERGYARLLGDQLDEASQDLDQAAGLTNDHKLLGQIWYNRGLIAEKQAKTEDALRAFLTSNQFNPTKAAEKKIAGAKSCALEVDRKSVAPAKAAGWLALFKLIQAEDYGYDDQNPASDQEAKKLLCEDSDCKETAPFLLKGDATQSLVIPQKGGSFLVFVSLGGLSYARCGMFGGNLEIAGLSPLRIKRTNHEPGEPGYDCVNEEGESLGEDTDPGQEGVSCMSFCADEGESSYDELFFDAKKNLVFTLSYSDEEEFKVSQSGTSIQVKGKTCEDSFTLP